MRYVQGKNRDQSTLFPAVIDDYITEDNPVRFIDYFVDEKLDLVELGFTYSEPKETGRMPYNPADNLKLYLYGYLNRIRSSRRLEAETHRNIELLWLIRSLHPDFKTIADFRKDNRKAIRTVCRAFTLLCREQGLFDLEFFAIDGSKFSAVAHKSKAFTKNKLNELVQEIDQYVDEYLETLDKNDDDEKEVTKPTAEQLQQKINDLKERRSLYESYQQLLEESGETQIVLTDPDSRLMRTGHDGWDVCYNTQFAIDKKHKLIADFDVTSDGNDLHQLLNMTSQLPPPEAVA
jgi:transposase